MKKEEIPQDRSKLEDKNIREVCYAVDKDGKYTTGLSTGWEAKSIALDLSMEHLNEQIEEARQAVLNGSKSPIYYFMWKEKMDVGVLAGYMHKYRWKIKRHFKPKVFNKLNTNTKAKYAEIFGIELKQLENFNE
ncbi:MAG: hypothetical protein WC994_00115 [Brumimicrobium sp.]